MSSDYRDASLQSGPICDDFSDQSILFAEAMGAGSYKLPPDVSFKAGKLTRFPYLVIQIHYKDATPFAKNASLADNSGIGFEYQTKPTALSAGVLLLGSGGAISSHDRSVSTLDVACTPTQMPRDRSIVPFAYRTHAHKYGMLVSGFNVASDAYGDFSWTLIGRKSPQEEQTFYPVEQQMVIRPEDTLAARCTYWNPSGHTVSVGPTADDEMCNFYIMYYTDKGDMQGHSVCFTSGRHSWDQMLSPLKVPSWVEQSSLQLSPEEQPEIMETMKKKMETEI